MLNTLTSIAPIETDLTARRIFVHQIFAKKFSYLSKMLTN